MKYCYILLVFHDQECSKLNAIWCYDSIKQIIEDTNGVLRYSDVSKKVRVYKTSKSFFRILKVTTRNMQKYFK